MDLITKKDRVSQYMKDSFKQITKAAIVGLAVFVGAYAHDAKAGITLGNNVQVPFSIVEDASTDGYDVAGYFTWRNLSDNFPANNQISANGLFGEVDSGLYNISAQDLEHLFNPPTYSILNNSFNITYANGVVNPPGETDTFLFKFNLGADSTLEQANAVVSELNSLISGTMQIGDSQYALERSINGYVSGGGIPKPFDNSPLVYVPNIAAIPEPATMGLLGIGAIAGLAVRKLKRVYSL